MKEYKFKDLFNGSKERYLIATRLGVRLLNRGGDFKSLFREHVDGKTNLAIAPINEDNKCFFGAIHTTKTPVFFSQDQVKRFEEKISTLNLPLNVFRSIPGGIILYLFVSDGCEAMRMASALHNFKEMLDMDSGIAYPDLTKACLGENFVKLPYHEGNTTKIFCVKNGRPLSLKKFLKEARVITNQELKQLEVNFNQGE